MKDKKCCRTCNVIIKKSKWKSHMKSIKHRRKPFIYCKYCKVRVKRASYNKHLKSQRHKRNHLFSELTRDYDIGEEYVQERNPNFEIVETKSKLTKKFNAWKIDYKININPEVPLEQLEGILNELMDTIKRRTFARNGDKINLIVTHPQLHNPISTGLVTIIKARNLIIDLCNQLTRILTSNEAISINECDFHVQFIAIPQGQGGSQKIVNLQQDIRTKKCITSISNDDNLCAPRAIITALTYHMPNVFVDLGLTSKLLTGNEITYIRKGRQLQEKLAINLLNVCNIQIPNINSGLTLEDIKKVEKKLDIQINIICAESFNSIIYNGSDKPIKIYLYKNKNHFDVINSMTGLLGSSYYCHNCKKPYNNKNGHECLKKKQEKKLYSCNVCNGKKHSDEAIKNPIWKECNSCFRYFFNEECFNNHKANKTCETIWKCIVCNKILLWKDNSPYIHTCGEKLCKNCNNTVPPGHKCYMKRKQSKGGYCIVSKEYPCRGSIPSYIGPVNQKRNWCYSCKTYTEKYIFFDFECMQETSIHIPNLVVTSDFEENIKIFNDSDDFCKWLIKKEHRNYTAIAHNAKGYDSQFILKYCVENTLKPYTIYDGTKLNLLEIPDIKLKIIDSINFVQGSLSSFPKTFGLTELKKGYFPHFFNKKYNQSYVGPMPSKRHYGYDQMKREERQEFLKWYNEKVKEEYIFDLKKELLEYCKSDVDILRRGCIKLREEFLEIANIDPFQYLTIASVCMAIYRSKYLIENTIAILEEEFHKDTYSKESICWLDYIMEQDKINIQHALNDGEKILLGNRVDGYCEETNTVYQFHGCFWHGCPKCFDPDRINNKNQKVMKDLCKKTLEISEKIKCKYNLVEMWECDFNKNKENKKFKKDWNREVITPLNPRDAFYGGRTNATKLIYNCRNSHKIRYIDVCSLYPTVQFYDHYPVGHPVKIYNPDYYNKKWYGFIKCKVIPPRKLYHPVLPAKIHTGKSEKLLFPLCYTCAKNKMQKCTHIDNERAIIGTWTTDETNKAIEKGYKIEKIYEVWHFEEKSNQLFRGYVKDFMKIKLETSPWKNDFKTLDEYIKEVKERLDITLEKEKIIENPGKRAVAKICLNSLWGKFGQRTNISKTEYVTDIKRFYDILLDDRLDNLNLTFLNEEMVQISYCLKDVFVEHNYNTNIFVAGFTTSNARLRLYEMLDYLGENVAYYDTDSIVYVDNGTKSVKTGCMLGDWTDELEGKYITHWVSTGPKSYAYTLNNLSEKCKIKGFYLNYENSQFLNHKAMSKMIKGEIKNMTIVEENKITRDHKTKNIVSKYQEKLFSFDYDKRVVNKINDDHIDTLPYGS